MFQLMTKLQSSNKKNNNSHQRFRETLRRPVKGDVVAVELMMTAALRYLLRSSRSFRSVRHNITDNSLVNALCFPSVRVRVCLSVCPCKYRYWKTTAKKSM